MAMQYIIAKKIKGKWYGLAGCNLGAESCIAGAEKVFKAGGIELRDYGVKTSWGDRFEAQGNYAGRLPEFKDLTPDVSTHN